MTWASRKVFASRRRQAKRQEGWRMERAFTEKKAAEIRDFLGAARRYSCLHCGGVYGVETILGRAGNLKCSDANCDGNPLDWTPLDAQGHAIIPAEAR